MFLDPEPFWEGEGKKQGKTPVYVLGVKQFPQHIELLKELWKNLTGLLENGDIKVSVVLWIGGTPITDAGCMHIAP